MGIARDPDPSALLEVLEGTSPKKTKTQVTFDLTLKPPTATTGVRGDFRYRCQEHQGSVHGRGNPTLSTLNPKPETLNPILNPEP